MEVLKTIAIILVGLVGLILIVALFVEKDYTVTRDIIINRSKADVFAYIRNLKNHKNFSTWEQMVV